MSGYVADLGELESIVAALAADRERLERLAADLDLRIAALHATWSGDAARAHAAAHEQWRLGLAELGFAVAGLRAAARRAHGRYTDALGANLTMWQALG